MKNQQSNAQRHSFSYRVNVGSVAANPLDVWLEATEDERLEMAERWGVLSVESVRAQLHLNRWKRDGVRIKGTVEAALTQSCVVTLEPVSTTVSETIDALFVPENSRLARLDVADDGEIVVDADGPDVPETFHGDSIDVGAVSEEFIVLALDPYPRSEGAVFQPDRSDPEGETLAPSPFAELKAWKKPQ